MKKNFMDRLIAGDIILFDGAMGTLLYDRGIFFNRCFDELNLSNPKLVKDIHKEYLRAGADVLTTNSFGATTPRLKSFGFHEQIKEINQAGVDIAKKIIIEEKKEHDSYIAGDIGPLGLKIEPLGSLSVDNASEYFVEQAQALYDAGIDLFVIETFTDLKELEIAINSVKKVCNLPIIGSITIREDGNSILGMKPEVYTNIIDKAGADIIGINCSDGPKSIYEVIEIVRNSTEKPLAVQPNAGLPKNVNGRNLYLTTPEYIAEYTRRFIQKGVNIVGGCCGTNPLHIREMRNSIRLYKPTRISKNISINNEKKLEINEPKKIDESELKQKIENISNFSRKIKNKEFVISVELVPPKNPNSTKIVKSSKILKEKGIDIINIPDGPRASSRMSALATSVIIEREAKIETVLHYVCRDKNLLGIQSELLGAYALGLRNLLLLTGDPPKMGTYPDATAVFDIDSIGLCNLVNSLNNGYDLGENPISDITFFYGVGANPGAINFESEFKRLIWKIEAGAEFIITQPVFDVNIFFKFLNEMEKNKINIPVIAGVWPLISYRNAEFMNNEVPGATVPDNIMERMRKCETKEEGREEGIKIASELFQEIKNSIAGVQLSAPFGNINYALEIIGKM